MRSPCLQFEGKTSGCIVEHDFDSASDRSQLLSILTFIGMLLYESDKLLALLDSIMLRNVYKQVHKKRASGL